MAEEMVPTLNSLLFAEFGVDYDNLVRFLPTSTTVEPYEKRPLTDITMLVLHHTDTSRAVTPETVARYNVDSNGWAGIGYSIYVRDYKGRCRVSLVNYPETRSYHAHAVGNAHGLAVVVAGNFETTQPSPAEKDALRRITRVVRRWATRRPGLPVVGHGQVHGNDTTCPGKYLKEIIPMLNADTVVDDADLRRRIWEVAKGGQEIFPNPDSAIEKVMREQGHTPIGKELPVYDANGKWAGVTQLGYFPGGNPDGLAFFGTNLTSDGEWGVHEVERPL